MFRPDTTLNLRQMGRTACPAGTTPLVRRRAGLGQARLEAAISEEDARWRDQADRIIALGDDSPEHRDRQAMEDAALGSQRSQDRTSARSRLPSVAQEPVRNEGCNDELFAASCQSGSEDFGPFPRHFPGAFPLTSCT